MKFYFTYGSSGMAYEGGWTEVEAPSRATAISAESTPLTVTRVELYNSDNALWAHQDCSITVNTGQTGILYWFDFTVTEQVVKTLLAKGAKPTQNYVVTEQEVKRNV